MPTVEPWRPNSTPPPPAQLERRPSFEGQAPNVGRLGVFVLLAAAVGGGAYLGGLPSLGALGVGVVVLVVFWAVDLAFTTGYLHKLSEQRTEQQRINASLLDVMAVNAAQDELFDAIDKRFATLDARISAVETIRITEQGKSRDINKMDALDIQIKAWVMKDVFNSNGILTGTHPNGQLKGSMPFKQGSDGYERLVWAQLITKDKGGYIWTGPQTLADTLTRLEIRRGGIE